MAVDRQQVAALAIEVAAFVPDVARLLRDVARDPRVPRRAKVEAALAAAYLLVPVDVIPDVVPVLGQLDDLAVAGWAVHRLLQGAGEDVLRQHWRGSERGLELLFRAAEAGLRPRRMVRLLAESRARQAATAGSRPTRSRAGIVVDGELVDRPRDGG